MCSHVLCKQSRTEEISVGPERDTSAERSGQSALHLPWRHQSLYPFDVPHFHNRTIDKTTAVEDNNPLEAARTIVDGPSTP